MSIQDEITRQTNINLQLRRQLEACRREVLEKCAKFCEDHAAGYHPRAGCYLMPRTGKYGTHAGQAYAKGIRDMIGSHKKLVASP